MHTDFFIVLSTSIVKSVLFLPTYQSVLVDEDSAKKLQSVVTQANVVINVPFIIIGVGILLGIVFIMLMCRQEVRNKVHYNICNTKNII